jgi:ribosomal-protein-alanine N-acetyltransferase
VLRGGDIACRVQHWSFQPRTAQLVLYHQQRLPSLADFQRWSERLAELGYTKVRTTALGTPAGLRAETAGFHSIQELVLLEHTDPRTPGRTRSVTTATQRLLDAQYSAASEVDVAAFGSQWALEPSAVADVCSATPRHRARGVGSPLTAYAITGRDAKQGFLQRLAVAPGQQRRGLGQALVLDSLQWLARWRVQRVLVNTPVDNHGALALYEQLGFRRLGERLRVYEQVLT